MKEISIIGYGNLGKQFYSFLKEEDIFFNIFDDFYQSNDKYLKTNLFKQFIESKSNDFYVALGYNHLKLKNIILDNLEQLKKNIPSFIHETSFINKSSVIDNAVFIFPMCNIDQNVFIDKGSLINNSVTISHDSKIGKCCYVSPGVIISGNVSIDDYTFIGAGTIISNGVKIGKNVIVGVGTVITKDIPDDNYVIGNPMKFLNHSLNLK
jgi:sugar O-acyltransferase (sialic acid O-acetyltransferase NeuD family)